MGMGWLLLIMCLVFFVVMFLFINILLFSLEKVMCLLVVFGLVGVGGIGIELKVVMDLFNYDEVVIIILVIFVLVVLVEWLSVVLCKKVL